MTTSADAKAVLRSTDEKENFHRLTRLLMCGGVRLLREKFDSFHSPTDLQTRLGDPTIFRKLKNAKLSQPEWDILYPSTGTVVKSTDFDITLTFRLLRTICNLTKPLTGWNTLPNSTDLSLEAELVRIKYYRNHVYGHNQTMEINDSEFDNLWKEISEALLRIAESISKEKKREWEKAINEFRNSRLITEEQRYVDELKLWYKKDMEVKDAVEQLGDQLQQLNQKLDILICVAVEGFSQGRQPIASSDLPIAPMCPAAAASASTVIVPILEEQPQFGGAGGTSREHLEGDYQDPLTGSYIWRVILSPAYNGIQSLLEYLRVQLGVNVVSHREGSLLITVTCSSLQILEGLWEDYSSGNLSKVVEQTLVTPDVLEKLGLSELKLKTTITEEGYNKCKEFFLTRDKCTGSQVSQVKHTQVSQVKPTQPTKSSQVSQTSQTSQASQVSQVKDTQVSQVKPTQPTKSSQVWYYSPTIGKSKTIEEIDALSDIFHAMEALGISSKGLQTLDEMKTRVKTELNQSVEKPCWTAGQAFSILTEARDEDVLKKQALLKLYFDTGHCMQRMDEKILALLQKNVGNIKEKLEHHQSQLKREEYFLLVAGETGSGKSSLVNLILGEELLPYSLLSTSSTICELRYGEQPRIVAHFKDRDPETGLPIKEFSLKDPSSKQSYLQQISSYMYVHMKGDREKGSIYKKIELCWPHQLLKKGVVIIDSPGIGESDIMDEIVTQYLPQAFAFIYVINSANAGGVQKDRLEKLLFEVREMMLEGQESVSSQCALFVCNKWDQVPEKEVAEVRDHVIEELKKRWPGIDPNSQITYMSVKQASIAQNYGIVTEQFFSLMRGIKSMVLKSLEARLEMHWKWLDYLLSRIVYQAKAFVMHAYRDHDEVAKRMDSITRRLNQIEGKATEMKEELRNHLEVRVKRAVHELSEYLKSEEVRARFNSWTLDEVPKKGSSWEETNSNIAKVLKKRLQEIIEQWEEDNQILSHARKSLFQHSQQWYNIVEGELRNLQCAVTNDELDVPESIFPKEGLTTAEKVFIVVTSPKWVPVFLIKVLISAPVVGIVEITNKMKERSMKKEYETDECAFMARTSADYLDDATKESVLKLFVDDQMKEAELSLKKIEDRIPERIEADKMLYKELRQVSRSQIKKQEIYQLIMDQASKIMGRLAVFVLKEIRAVDISSEELDWNEETSPRLGCGTFATVYQGQMRRQGEEQTVALKVCREELEERNASLILEEVERLRKLEHPYIVKFFGASLLKKEASTRVIMVMEKCKGNLKSQIFNHPEAAPAKTTNPAVFREVCRWAKESTHALAFIHEQGIVHRDLKLENILLSEDGSAKITDVGVSKKVDDITGTLAGTPLHIAPEVFHSEIYDSKADIYSFGIILWEMWYGRQAFAEFEGTKERFFKWVDEGNRPKAEEGSKKPPDRWKRLMIRCWDRNPEQRPTANECNQEITTLSQEAG